MSAEPATAYPPLLIERRAPLLRITLNRPDKFNVLSTEMMQALEQALLAASQDAEIRVVVLAGAGRAFCTGHDLRELHEQAQDAHAVRQLFQRCSQLMLAIQRLPQPVIARVQGVATAAGCQLVAMCDLAVAAADARFAVSGINLGLFCSTPSVALSRNISRKQALEMLLTGDFIDAQTALARGLVNRVVPAEELDAEIERLAHKIAAKSASAVAIGKAQFYEQIEMPIAAAYERATHAMVVNMAQADARAGIDEFLNKPKVRS
jgi:enoyl-CoA hydratase/carnithine racemase